ncbi:Gfo/Idh/MocA family oxidoreductase [Micromonospora sp. NPDC051196]|uniref:Gfo/Idh/MocA family protein n=1 Tax=Micromonospora sp. NPDC051196 TaxID=3155281 RepID=UPI003425C7A1
MSAAPRRVGVIGTGFGEQHLRWLANCPETTVAQLAYDTDRDRAEALAAKHHIPQVVCGGDTLVAGDLDLVVIASPVSSHGRLAGKSVRLGRATVCEKPLALTAGEAASLAAVAAEAAVPTMVMFQWRLHPAFQALRDLVRSGGLGDLVHVDLRFHHDFLVGHQSPFAWRHDRALAGAGAFADQAVHLADLLLWLAGRPFEVIHRAGYLAWPTRRTATATITARTEDVGAAILSEPASGLLATMAVSRVSAGHRAIGVTIAGLRGTAEVRLDPDNESAALLMPEGGAMEWPAYSLGNPYSAFLSGDRNVATFDDGVAAQLILDRLAEQVTGQDGPGHHHPMDEARRST